MINNNACSFIYVYNKLQLQKYKMWFVEQVYVFGKLFITAKVLTGCKWYL